jgi:hypothetical protein
MVADCNDSIIVQTVHCKKELAVFPSPAGMSLIKLFLGGNNLVFSCPEIVWSVTSRLGTGKWLTLFYSVCVVYCESIPDRGTLLASYQEDVVSLFLIAES